MVEIELDAIDRGDYLQGRDGVKEWGKIYWGWFCSKSVFGGRIIDREFSVV